MILVFVVIVGVLLVLQRRWLMRRQAVLTNKLQTNIRTLPILGHSYMFIGTSEDRMNAFHALGRDAIEVGGISKFIHLDQLFVCVADPAVAEVLLAQCLEKHDLVKMMDFLVGNASIIAPVPIWRHRRKVDAPIFKMTRLQQFVKAFSEHGAAMADQLEQEVGKGTFSLFEYAVVTSMSAVCETTMGVKINFRENEFLTAIEEMWAIGAYLMCQPWLKSQLVFKLLPLYRTAVKNKQIIYDFITKIIRNKQKEIHEKRSNGTYTRSEDFVSFLDLQLDGKENARKFSELELTEETLLIVVAGYDTVATSLAYTLLVLSRHSQVQDKVFEELHNVFGESNRAVTNEDLRQLDYLEAVIKETLRLYPIVPLLARHVDKDVTLPSGLTIVKDCAVLVNVWAVHRNPGYWGEDAEQFRPERFLSYSAAHPAQYMPFSYGPRGCPGYQYALILVKCMVSSVLRRYRVLAPPGVAPAEPLRTKFEMLSRHSDNCQIQLERRAAVMQS